MQNDKKRARILIVDDVQDTCDIFRRQLEDDYEIETANSAFTALEKLSKDVFHIAMTDLVMPGVDGIELMNEIKKRWPHVSVIVISGKATIEMAVKAMKSGAEDFIEKPVEDLDLLKLIIERILRAKWQTEEIERLRSILDQGFDRGNIIGNSLAVQKTLEKVRKIAPLDTTVLITGETGVGKELIADLIYRNSKRKDKRFVAVNCGSLPENLLESMLFGHIKGAFTTAVRDKIGYFQEASGGTLFLDEVTETSGEFQVKLLRALEKGIIRQVGGDRDIEVDVRIIAATNKDIEEEVNNGNFREDLFYRLNVINIHIPPIRERVEDIELLASAFVDEFSKKNNKPNLKISEPVLSILSSAEWKGNIRELKNAMEHAVALTSHDKIIPEDLPERVYQRKELLNKTSMPHLFGLQFTDAKEIFEKFYIKSLMEKCNGDITKAANISGIKRQNIYDKFKKYNISPDDYRKKQM